MAGLVPAIGVIGTSEFSLDALTRSESCIKTRQSY